MTPNEVIRDFRTKYQHTFVFVKDPRGSETLCRIDAISENRDRQAVIQLSSIEHGKLVINLASSYELKFRFPSSGSFQHGKDSFFIQRRAPHRQYQRGMCAANHVMHNCVDNVAECVNPTWDLEVVQAAFQPVKYRGSEALTILKHGKHRSVALGGMYSLCQPLDGTNQYVLFLANTMIGHVKEDLSFVPARGAELLAEAAQQALTEI